MPCPRAAAGSPSRGAPQRGRRAGRRRSAQHRAAPRRSRTSRTSSVHHDSCRGSTATLASRGERRAGRRRGARASARRVGGSCRRYGPSRSPRPAARSTRRATGSAGSRSRRMWVRYRLTLTATTKPSGVCSRHALEHRPLGQPVEGVVDLDRRELAGEVLQPRPLRQPVGIHAPRQSAYCHPEVPTTSATTQPYPSRGRQRPGSEPCSVAGIASRTTGRGTQAAVSSVVVGTAATRAGR